MIDSNSRWDGIVRLRTGYDPAAAAERFTNIDFHIYRFPTDPFPGGGDADSSLGEMVTVAAPGDCLNLRSEPRIGDNVITCLPDGLRIRLLGSSASADGYEWVEVATPVGTGWVATAFVVQGAGSPPEPVGAPPEVHRTIVSALAANADSEP